MFKRSPARCRGWIVVAAMLMTGGVSSADPLEIHMRSRQADTGTSSTEVERTVTWEPARTAVVIVDMWDSHHCLDSKTRVEEMAPRLNAVVKAARQQGMLIVHAPSGCMAYYKDRPQRRRAVMAPDVKAEAEIKWHNRNPDIEPELPVRPGCDSRNDLPRWKSQIATIEIGPQDTISDNGQEIYNVFEQVGIENVIVMGVHTNVCVLGRPFGIRQWVYHKKNVVLCRDLTDTYHRDPGRHFEGLAATIEHIERYWCPTMTSRDLTGEPPFRFQGDTTKGS